MTEYGYVLDYDDVMTILGTGKYMPQIERFGITADKKMWEKCVEKKIIPEYKFENIYKAREKLKLYRMCDRSVVPYNKIIKYMWLHELGPDKIALEYACSHNRNGKLIEYLVSPDTISFQCLHNYAKAYYNDLLEKLLQNLEIANTKEINKYKSEIKKLHKLLKTTNEKI